MFQLRGGECTTVENVDLLVGMLEHRRFHRTDKTRHPCCRAELRLGVVSCATFLEDVDHTLVFLKHDFVYI